MKTIVFALPGNERLASKLAQQLHIEMGEMVARHFPDEETFVRVDTDVSESDIFLVCALNHPDTKLLPLYFLSRTLKELGAGKITLIAPYLAYMRQDKRFNPGEAVTSNLFAKLLSGFIDRIVTIDPHLHRRSSLSEIYSVPTTVVHAAPLISEWIRKNILNALLVGPDSESEQWVSVVAKEAHAPFVVLQKIRHGDNDVEISLPKVDQYKNHTPVLVDDIISTARTMIETLGHLKKADMRDPVCIGVHGIFAGEAFMELLRAGAYYVVTTNSVVHASNRIEIAELILKVLPYNTSV
jgi:ribose-phosphate pyrophosphokinase